MTMQLLKLVTMHESDDKMSAHTMAVPGGQALSAGQAGGAGRDARAAAAQDPFKINWKMKDVVVAESAP